MGYSICKVKNIDILNGTYVGKTLIPNEIYVIPDSDRIDWADDQDVSDGINAAKLEVHDQLGVITTGYVDQIKYLQEILIKQVSVGNVALDQFLTFLGDRLKVDAELSSYQDGLSDALVTIDYPHHEIHGGSTFHYSDIDKLSEDEEYMVAITTPDTLKQAHIHFAARSEDEIIIALYENPTTLVKGSVITAYNRNRNSSNTNDIILNEVTSVASKGTRLEIEQFMNDETAVTTTRMEWVLAGNQTYLFYIESLDDSNDISYKIDWYEHTAQGE